MPMNLPETRPGQLVIRALVVFAWLVPMAGLSRSDTASLAALFDYLGRASAIAGLVLLLLAAALSARLPGLDRYFGGLTKLWRTHHLLGAGSLLLLMAHPLLLALAASGGSAAEATALLFPPLHDWSVWAGWTALVLMMVFLAPSFGFFGQPDYGRWKRLHRLAGPAVVIALLHSAQYGRTLSQGLETVLWLLMSVLALTALVWHFGLSRRFGRRRYLVERTIEVANNLVELVLKPAGRRRLEYQPGQFVYLTPYDKTLAAGHGEEHPYTLSSSPDEEVLRVAIKGLGDASRAIRAIRPGSRVAIEGPYGRFFREGEPARQLWIAGGIGITPFLAKARHLRRRAGPTDIRLVYCVQDEARARFLEELETISAQLPGFEVHPHFFYRQGPLNRDYLDLHVPDLATRVAFVCGPPGLNRLAKRLLAGAGISRRDIHTEEFELL